MRRERFSPGVYVAVVVLLGAAAGCITPIQLGVTPVAGPPPVGVEAACADAAGSAACLSARQPHYKVTVGAGERAVWARISPDGRTVVAAVVAKDDKAAATGGVAYVAVDTSERKQLWRIHLAPGGQAGAEECYFLGPDKVGFVVNSSILVVDRTGGREVWRYPVAGDKTAEGVYLPFYDARHDLLLVSGFNQQRVLDAQNGNVLATRARFDQGHGPRVTSGLPLVTDTDVYIIDRGLVRFGVADKKVMWSRKFITFTKDDYTGANIGLAIVSALFNPYGGGSNIPPDYQVGRPSVPQIDQGRIVMGSLGVVHCIDAESGALVWSKDFAVPQVDQVIVSGSRVYVLAGGRFVFWGGRAGFLVKEPVRYGLYCLNLADGSPVAAFQSPFNENKFARSLTAAQVEAYDEDDAFEEEEDWSDKPKAAKPAKPATTKATPAAPATPKLQGFYSKAKLVGMRLTEGGLLVTTVDEVALLDPATGTITKKTPFGDLGAALTTVQMGDLMVVRTTKGAVAFDAKSGELKWKRDLVPPKELRPSRQPGNVPYLRVDPWALFLQAEAQQLGPQMFWASDDANALLIPTDGPKLAGVHAADGDLDWQVPISPNVAIDTVGGQPHLCVVDGATVEVYRIPRSM